jgi:GNAT superfamily N-acetyltransferase
MEIRSLPGFELGELTRADIPDALRLVEEARWNQVRADWEVFITHGAALKVCTPEGALAATAAILPYRPRFGWISLVLVAGAQRGRGIATALLPLCVQRLRAMQLVPMLDATPAAHEVYLPLGFRDGWAITRWRRAADATTGVLPPPARPVRALQEADWLRIAALDARAFGADRIALLRQLAARSPSFACVVEEGGRLTGFLLGRDGRTATQLGPVVAEDPDTAHALLTHALPRVSGGVIVDALDRHVTFTRQLAQAGFAVERPYTRMALEREGGFGDAACMVAIAGPELG